MSLIAHYTLDNQAGIGENLLTNTNTASGSWYYWGANGTFSHSQDGVIHHLSVLLHQLAGNIWVIIALI